MKKIRVVRLLSFFMALLMLSCSAAVMAQAQDVSLSGSVESQELIELENGDKLVTTIQTMPQLARGSTIRRQRIIQYFNGKNEELCAFILNADFETATRKCVYAFYQTRTSGGSWRVEDGRTWRDTYTAYASFSFVQRILGIKVDSVNFRSESISY